MIIESFYSALSGAAGVAAITSSIYPKQLPPEVTRPAITYGMAQDEREPLVDGAMSDLKEALFDVDCWALSYADAHELAEAVEAALVGTTGEFGSLSPADVVDTIRLERKFDLFENDTRLYRVSLQFFVAYY